MVNKNIVYYSKTKLPTSFPFKNIPIDKRVPRTPRKVLLAFRVSIPCFRSISGSAIS